MSNSAYAMAVASYLKNQEVEIYCGDQGETHRFSETEYIRKHIIRGTIIDAKGDCLVVKVIKDDAYANVYINGWCIKSIVPVKDPLFVTNIYEDENIHKKAVR